jgi:epoxide hydrolase 4
MDLRERMVEVDTGVRLHVVEAGEQRDPPVILLHGFPEFWYSWRKQFEPLANAHLHVVAPDMRGYNVSDKPRGVDAYRTEILARDVARLIDSLGVEKASVVGHDWGAVVAWTFAMRHPDRLDRLGILNVPHPLSYLRGLRRPGQWLKSWYVLFFQLPAVPEALARMTNYAFVRQAMRGSYSAEDIQRYVEAMARPGALTATINYYRALVRYARPNMRHLRRIDQPVLVIWGERDAYLGRELAEPPRDWVPNVRLERMPGISHWVQHDAADRVNSLLIDFLQ